MKLNCKSKKMKNPFFKGSNESSLRDSSNTILLTPKMFFGGDGHLGYQFTRKSFIEYGKSLRDREVQDLGKMFNATKDGLIMGGNLTKRSDRAGRDYIHPEFYMAKARIGVKIMVEPGIEKFINDYQNGYVRNTFTLEELISEAQNVNSNNKNFDNGNE